MSPYLEQYLELERELEAIRRLHEGNESVMEDWLLDEMDKVGRQFTSEDLDWIRARHDQRRV